MEYPKRKHPRLKGYDYSQNGAYYVTICVENRRCILGEIDEKHIMHLGRLGEITKKYIEQIEEHYQFVKLVNYVIMPNHIHLLIQKDIPPNIFLENEDAVKTSPILQQIIHGLKTLTTKEIGRSIWQTSFYEHIIRNQSDIQRVSDYIDANPSRWREKS